MESDVRDVGGRALRLLASIALGAVLAVGLSVLLPQTERKPAFTSCLGGSLDVAGPFLIAAGACSIALGVHAVLAAIARSRRAVRVLGHAGLPRARVHRRAVASARCR